MIFFKFIKNSCHTCMLHMKELNDYSEGVGNIYTQWAELKLLQEEGKKLYDIHNNTCSELLYGSEEYISNANMARHHQTKLQANIQAQFSLEASLNNKCNAAIAFVGVGIALSSVILTCILTLVT